MSQNFAADGLPVSPEIAVQIGTSTETEGDGIPWKHIPSVNALEYLEYISIKYNIVNVDMISYRHVST